MDYNCVTFLIVYKMTALTLCEITSFVNFFVTDLLQTCYRPIKRIVSLLVEYTLFPHGIAEEVQ